MRSQEQLVGREHELKTLHSAVAAARAGQGGLLLVQGEAGMGKTRLVDEALSPAGVLCLTYACQELGTPAFAPVAAILRQFLRHTSGDLSACGPLAAYLNLLLPELGPAPADAGDQPTLQEAIRAALATLSTERPAAVVLDDLHWADNATMDLILFLSRHLPDMALLMIAIYRRDEIPRGHPVRRLRNQLRRARAAQELTLGPLDEAGTTAMAETVLGQPIHPALADILHQRSDGVPLFVEQLIAALESDNRLEAGDQGIALADAGRLPVPESIRDAVLLRLDRLPEAARRLAEVAAVAGERFDLEQIIELAGSDEGLDVLLERRFLIETTPGRAAFHHGLTREAVYQAIIWTRRRALHRALAGRLAEQGAAPEVVAGHWLAAQDTAEARGALVAAAQAACHIHAYRDAAGFGSQALELWPDDRDVEARLDVLDQLGHCAQLSGMLPEAIRAWREAAEGRRQLGQPAAYAAAQRRLAAALELQGAVTQALSARSDAARAFKQIGQATEAAIEYLALADALQSQTRFQQALPYAEEAVALATETTRFDLLARAKGLAGQLLALTGQADDGIQQAREALALAMDHGFSGAAAEVFGRLGSTLEQASDYGGSRAVYHEAADYCSSQGDMAQGTACLGCLAFVLRRLGDWDEAEDIARGIIDAPESPELLRALLTGMRGQILVFRGQLEAARPLLQEALLLVRKNNYLYGTMHARWGLAMLSAGENRPESALEHWQQVLDAWETSEDLHHGIEIFRWGATQFARWGKGDMVQQATSCLSRIATDTANPEALAGLAHGLGESLLLAGEAVEAVRQFGHAAALLAGIQAPLDQAHTAWRLGSALKAAGEPERAARRLLEAGKTFKALDARPLYREIESQLIALDAAAQPPMSPREGRRLKRAGLTRRQFEVLGLLARGMTNKDIAAALVLSPRTVEMHVANIFNKLGCHNRAEAVARAAELELLGDEA